MCYFDFINKHINKHWFKWLTEFTAATADLNENNTSNQKLCETFDQCQSQKITYAYYQQHTLNLYCLTQFCVNKQLYLFGRTAPHVPVRICITMTSPANDKLILKNLSLAEWNLTYYLQLDCIVGYLCPCSVQCLIYFPGISMRLTYYWFQIHQK